jgi:hypothetical protein
MIDEARVAVVIVTESEIQVFIVSVDKELEEARRQQCTSRSFDSEMSGHLAEKHNRDEKLALMSKHRQITRELES